MSTNKKTLIDGDFQVGSNHFVVDTENNYVGFNNVAPQNKIDVQIGARTGTHSTGKPLYVTGVTNTSGAEFVSDDGTTGTGIGSSNIFTTGANQNLTIAPDGTGAVGIKTATPNPSGETFDLWVQGDTKITGNVTVNEIFGDGSGLFNVAGTQWVSSSEDIYFLNNTGSGSGRVAIGTTTPVSLLTLEGASGGAPPTTGQEGTSNALVRVRDDNNVTLDIGTSSGTSWLQSSDATAMGTNYSISINPNGGNVGIGTISPNVPLEVSKSAGGEMLRLTNGTGTLYAGVDANPPWFGTSSDDHLRLVTNGTEKVRIESGGNVGIGTDTPVYNLDVNNEIQIRGQGLVYHANETSDSENSRFFLRFNKTLDASYPMLCNRTPNGDVVIATGTSTGGNDVERMRFNGGDGTRDIEVTNANFIVSGNLTAGTIDASKISNATVGDSTGGVKAVYFENTENNSTYYTDKNGILAFDENFYSDTEYGTGTYDPSSTFVGGNGGGLLIKNEDGWGAIFTSQNTRWAKGYWNSLDVSGGVTATTFTGALSTSVTPGSYLTGSAYNGSTARTFAVDATTTNTASKIVARDSNGDIFARYFRGEYVNISHSTGTRNSDTIFYSSTDAYIRKNNASGMRSSLGLANSATIEATTADTANKIAQRNSSGDIFARLFRSDYQNQSDCGAAIAFRNSTTDNYIRFCSDMGAVRSRIGCAATAGTASQNFSANTIYIGNSTSRGLRSVSGNYGTVQTTGGGAGGWEGYSINGRYVFMSADNNSCGIYNDLDNEWMVYCYRNSYTKLYFNGSEKLETINTGVTILGNGKTTGTFEADGRIYADNGCHVRGDWLRVNGSNGIYFESHGGGWHMTDSTWVRAYNSKSILTNGNIYIQNAGRQLYFDTGGAGLYWGAGYSRIVDDGNIRFCTDDTMHWNIGSTSSSLGTQKMYLSSTFFHIGGDAIYCDILDDRTAFNKTNPAAPVDVSGTCRATSFSTSSDRRIKKNIIDIDDRSALETIRSLQPKKYEYVDSKLSGTNEQVWGFIAQEVEDVMPYAINTVSDFIPNIFEWGKVVGSNVIVINTSNFLDEHPTLEIKDIRGKKHTVTIEEIVDTNTVRIKEDLTDWTGSLDEEGNVISETTTTTITVDEYEALEDKTGYTHDVSGYQKDNVRITVEEFNNLKDTNGYERIIRGYIKSETKYPGSQLFVNGQMVDDFKTIKKHFIWTVATAALQEVDRQLQAEKVKTKNLEALVLSLITRVQKLEQK